MLVGAIIAQSVLDLDAARVELSGSSFPVMGIRSKEKSTMSATATRATFDQEEMKRIMIRWRLAEDYLSNEDDSLPSEHALRVLIRQDVPSLLREVIRLRPDLA